MKIVLIIQARMNSERLPGKILKPVMGRPMLEHLIDRIKQVNEVNEIVLATTKNKSDQPVVDLGRRQQVTVFQGSEEDVLGRFYDAAQLCRAEAVVRVTGDCPLIDPSIISKVIGAFLNRSNQIDYASNTLKRTFPRGMDTEVFSIQALAQAHLEARSQHEREHVTPFIYQHPERFRLSGVEHLEDLSRHRWTVDTPEDFQLIEKIYATLYPSNPSFALEDILDVIQLNPEWENLNAHIIQKSH